MVRLNLNLCVSLSATTLIASVMGECSRSTLQDAATSYVTAQTSGAGTIPALSDSVTYTENDKTGTVKGGILSQALKIDHNRSTYDTTACATYTELIITDSKHPYVIGTQMHFTDNKVTKMQTLVTDAGDWLFNATGTLYWASRETWDTIPEAKRDTRDTIQKAADAYCNIFKDKNTVVPWGTPCARLEGGSYTGKGAASDRCDVGIPSNVDLTNRRYVIDETLGTVDVFLNFGGTSGLPDSHEFRVEGGKIRYVHTITVMNK